MTETLRRCRNIACLYVGDPDPREYPGCEDRCPRCGTPWNQRPAWKGPLQWHGGEGGREE